MSKILLDRMVALPENTKGILLALVSTALFVVVGVIVRQLSDRFGVFQILFFRQLVFMTILLPAISKNVQTLFKPRFVKLHFLRITGAFVALSLGFLTVSNIPLVDATALGFTQVLFVALISRMALSEVVEKMRQLTIMMGFVGVMLVVRPSFENTSILYSATGLIAALGAAVAVICVRKIAKVESTINLLVYQAIFVGMLALIPSLFFWQTPTLTELLLLVLVGAISSVAQWFGVTAYKHGTANVVSNVEYMKMIYSLGLGYWLFAEIPDSYSLAGAAVILGSPFLPYLFASLKQKVQIKIM